MPNKQKPMAWEHVMGIMLSALFAPVWHQRASMALLGAMGLCSCS